MGITLTPAQKEYEERAEVVSGHMSTQEDRLNEFDFGWVDLPDNGVTLYQQFLSTFDLLQLHATKLYLLALGTIVIVKVIQSFCTF